LQSAGEVREIVRCPTVSRDQVERHRLGCVLGCQATWVLDEARTLIADVQLLEQHAQQTTGPPEPHRLLNECAKDVRTRRLAPVIERRTDGYPARGGKGSSGARRVVAHGTVLRLESRPALEAKAVTQARRPRRVRR
jgi:hypothetical protein